MGKLLFRIARLRVMGIIVGFMFTYVPFLIPIKKIEQSKDAVSFFHPSPTYPAHMLIIPRKIARTVFCLSGEDFIAVMDMAVKIRQSRFKANAELAMIINGGARQDVMQAHFHLFSGNMMRKRELSKDDGIGIELSDKTFWAHFVSKLETLLQEYDVSADAFSILIQFQKNHGVSLFLI